MSAAGRIASLIEGLSEGDAELKEPLHAELKLLFASCPQVRLPAANQKIFFNGDAKLPSCTEGAATGHSPEFLVLRAVCEALQRQGRR